MVIDVASDLEPIEWSTMQLLRRLPTAHFASALADPLYKLHPIEEAVAADMTAQRRDSFVAGRIAIGHALRAAGSPPVPVGASADGIPTLPDGYIGSIAHKHGRALAVVAHAGFGAGIGVDLEFDEGPDDSDLRDTVLTTAEAEWLPSLASAEADLASPVTLVLAAKEALYKAVFPVLRSHFDFDDVELSFIPHGRFFRASRFPGDAHLRVKGYYSLARRWIATVAVASRCLHV
jgi:4'-phosphopantetheinyl transferase EntD